MRDDVGGLVYVRAHLEEALATDARVSELGLHVEVDGDDLVVSGVVSTPERQAAISVVAADVAGGFCVRNETRLVCIDEPAHPEEPV